MHNARRWLVLALTAGVGSGVGPAAAQSLRPDLDTLLIRRVTGVLAHDSMGGRDTGRPGAMAAAQFLAAECAAAGLHPVGAAFLHPVPMVRAVIDTGGSHLTLSSANGRAVFSLGPLVLPVGSTVAARRGFRGRAVIADVLDTVALATVPLTGTVLVGGNPLVAPAVGAWLARKGVAGIVGVTLDTEPLQRWRDTHGDSVLYLTDDMASSFHSRLPAILAGPDVAVAVRRLAVLDPTAIGPDPPSALYPAIDVTVTMRDTQHPVDAANVVCALPGRTRDTALAFTAHYDHLGTTTPDAAGDSIYNGFSDNAAGVGMVLAIARTLAKRHPAPRYTTLFLFFTGEERGLLGSDYFVTHSPWPLERIRAVVNLDAGAPAAPPTTWRVAGVTDGSRWGRLVRGVAAARGWTLTTSPARANSDYYPFARVGVPALFVIPGPGPYEGLGADSSDALRARWDFYHHRDDEWDATFPLSGLERYAAFALALADAVAADTTGL